MLFAKPIKQEFRDDPWEVSTVLWRLSEPIVVTKPKWGDEGEEVKCWHVQTSASNIPEQWGGPETLVFATDAEGEWITGIELAGVRGTLDHIEALSRFLENR